MMEYRNISDLRPRDRKTRPNKFTLHMGEKIRSAREESGFTQKELALKLYLIYNVLFHYSPKYSIATSSRQRVQV